MQLVQKSWHQEVAAALREQIYDDTVASGGVVDEVKLCAQQTGSASLASCDSEGTGAAMPTLLTLQREASRDLTRSQAQSRVGA